jgi:hypothetical protein
METSYALGAFFNSRQNFALGNNFEIAGGLLVYHGPSWTSKDSRNDAL